MSEPPPILGYASPGGSLERSEGIWVTQLQRPAIWPRIIAASFVSLLFGSIFGWLLSVNIRFIKEWIDNPFHTVHLVNAALMLGTGFVSAVSLRAIIRLMRARTRPIVLAVENGMILIEDPAVKAGIQQIDSRKATKIELSYCGLSLALEKMWVMAIENRFHRLTAIYFIPPNAVEASRVVLDLKTAIGIQQD